MGHLLRTLRGVMTPTRTELSIRMHALADGGHERAAELREKADAFDVATAGLYGVTPTHTVFQLMGCWARARRAWSECTGEPLI